MDNNNHFMDGFMKYLEKMMNGIRDVSIYIFIDKEYEINPVMDAWEQFQQYIMRYRRIIGIIMLIILIGIKLYCDDFIKSTLLSSSNNSMKIKQKGGAGAIAATAGKAIASSGAAQAAVASAGQAAASSAGEAVGEETTKKLGKLDEIKGMRAAGFSKKQIAGRMGYQAGAYVGEKFKEFATWLYEILFAIAISIAICMVVMPSISFFILGLVCYFLLKSKISGFKAL